MLAALTMSLPFRPPAVPLVTHTPFFSCWSAADRLTDRWPTHWTGGTHAMLGLVRVDGKIYRWMGPNPWLGEDTEIPALAQTSVRVLATRTLYSFEGAGIRLEVEFCSPLLPDNLEALGRPATYLTLSHASLDGKPHEVDAYVDWSGEWVVQEPSQKVAAPRHRLQGMELLSMRAVGDEPLSRSGDQIRISWGTLYVAGPGEGWIAGHSRARLAFLEGKGLPDDDLRFPRPAKDDWPVLALTTPLRSPQTFIVALDEEYGVEYLRRRLRPYWNRNEIGAAAMLRQAADEAAALRQKCREFDERLWKELEETGGEEYALIGSLAYRQCLAGHTLAADLDGDLLMFSKENTSNGCIATVDVTFPASPFFLHFNTEMLKAQLRPILEYASLPRWPFDFAPHDLGTHPLANGQVYGGGEKTEEDQMPVEESANMLLMVAAVCRKEGGTEFAQPYASLLSRWAGYLEREGLDPANQLCTDDFTGHLAHNANLSIKAIVALAAYGELAASLGESSAGEKYRKLSKEWAAEWMKKADDGDHTRLAFDRAGTWSQKYNLFWDRLLGTGLFPESLYRSELAWYRGHMNRHGFPLDNRADFTKVDWELWCAALAQDRSEFDAMVKPVYLWLHETPSRVPFSDWYETKTGEARSFAARTVVGGVFAPMLLRRGLPKR